MSVTDMESRRKGGAPPDEEVGVVESDAAEDTAPDYEAMSDDEREQAVAELVATDQVTDDEARLRVYGEEPKPTPPMQIPLPGDWDKIGGEFGGRAPDTSEIRLLGGKMPIHGSFAKGTVIDLLVRVKVTGVLGQDTVDAFGQEESTIRRHMARMISVQRINNPSS